jgi:nicotinamidase-related amidase
VVLWKPRWSAFYRSGLDAHLAGLSVSTLVIAGCNFPHCPRSALFDASARDYRVVMVSDAISGVMPYHLEESRRIGVVPLPGSRVIHGLRAAAPPAVTGNQ